MRFTLCVVMLTMSFIALQCTADSAVESNKPASTDETLLVPRLENNATGSLPDSSSGTPKGDDPSANTASDSAVSSETATITEATESVPREDLTSSRTTKITVTDTSESAKKELSESGAQGSDEKTHEVRTDPKPETLQDAEPTSKQDYSTQPGTTTNGETSSTRETSTTANGVEGTVGEISKPPADTTRTISDEQDLQGTTVTRAQPAKPQTPQVTLQIPQTPSISTKTVSPPATISTAPTNAATTGHIAVAKNPTAQATATDTLTRPQSPVKKQSPTRGVSADNSANLKKTYYTDNATGTFLEKVTSNTEGKDNVPVQTLTSNTSTAAPTTSTNTSDNSTSESTNTDSTGAPIPSPKFVKRLQNADLKDGGIDSSSLPALIALATLTVMVIALAF